MAKSRSGPTILFILYLVTLFLSAPANTISLAEQDQHNYSMAANAGHLGSIAENFILTTEISVPIHNSSKSHGPGYSIFQNKTLGSLKKNMLQPNSSVVMMHVIHGSLPVYNRVLRC